MKKEELLKLGLDEATATKVAEASTEELKGFIPKVRFDEVNNDKKALELTIKERDGQLETLKNSTGDAETLKTTIKTLQTQNATEKANYDAKIMQMQVETALKEQLSGVGVSGDVKVKMVKALLDLEKPELVEGKIKGLDDQLKKLQEAEETKGMFTTSGKGQQTFKGMKPGESGDKGGNTGITKEQFNKMGYSEKVKLFNSDKDLYDTLTSTN